MEACFQFVRCTTREGFLPLGLGGWSAPPLPAAVGATGLSMEPVYTAAAVTLEARQACLHAPHLAKDLAVIFHNHRDLPVNPPPSHREEHRGSERSENLPGRLHVLGQSQTRLVLKSTTATPVLPSWPGYFGRLPAGQHFAAIQTPAFLPPQWLGCPPERRVLLGVRLCLVTPRRTPCKTSVRDVLKQRRSSHDLSFTLGLILPWKTIIFGGPSQKTWFPQGPISSALFSRCF